MFTEIKVGLTHSVNKMVMLEDSVINYGSGLVEVFATPAMIALMEKTALECVNHLLPDGYTTVGTELNIKHFKATAIGKKVNCKAKVIELDRKKIIFKLSAEDKSGEIGCGTHTRFIVNEKDFMAKLD